MTEQGSKRTFSHAPTGEKVALGSAAACAGPAVVSVVDSGGLAGAERVETMARHAGRALQAIGVTGDVRVRLVGDGEMAAAHAQYMNDPTTTDVLTFDMSEGASAPLDLGGQGGPLDVDILVCVDEARRQASRREHELERELLLYIVHGVLHCLGHNDHAAEDAARMHAEEDRILSTIGIGATYARPENRAPEQPELGGQKEDAR